jgi:hypothetical protein
LQISQVKPAVAPFRIEDKLGVPFAGPVSHFVDKSLNCATVQVSQAEVKAASIQLDNCLLMDSGV